MSSDPRATAIPWHRPMSGRDPDEAERASSPLELFLDLCFVVAVAAAASSLHHGLAEGHLDTLVRYAMVFFAIWWAWVNYSWLASAYDPGDVQFRLLTFVVMVGVLVLAVGVPRAEASEDFSIIVAGYVVMRLALIPLWLRVAAEDPAHRHTALRYAGAVLVVQVLWILRLLLGDDGTVALLSFLVLVVAELAVPAFAEDRSSMTPWHPHHIAERYQLFTIIVLGEVLLSTTDAISAGLDGEGLTPSLSEVVVGSLLLVFGLWWLYFKRSLAEDLSPRTSFVFGYLHFVVFASVAAVGACLAVVVDALGDEAEVAPRTLALVLALAVAAYLVSLGVVESLGTRPVEVLVMVLVVTAALVAVALLGLDPALTTLLLGLVVAAAVVHHTLVQRRPARSGASVQELDRQRARSAAAGRGRPRRTAARGTCSTSGRAASA